MIVVAALDAWLSVAVTVVVPPFSAIDESATASVTPGAASPVSRFSTSLPLKVRLAPVTVPTPWLFCAVPPTVTGWPPTLLIASFSAVIVTLSDAFAVSPAAISIVASVPTV